MVAAGIMCQIYSMKGFSRKLSSGEKKCQKVKEYFKKKEKQKKHDEQDTPPQERLFESTLKPHSNVSVYLPSLCHTQNGQTSSLKSSLPHPPSSRYFFPAPLSSTVLKCATDMPV